MDDKVKQIYKQNLTYSVLGIIVYIGLGVIMGVGDDIFQTDVLRVCLFILFIGGVRGFYLTQKLKK